MPVEIEAKFLDVDHDILRARLKELGATLKQPNRLTKRLVLDFPDRRLHAKDGWVRLRDEGDKITLTYKQLNTRSLSGMQEVELVVDDFEQAKAFLQAIGLQPRSYQETKRESWVLDEAAIELDEWPWIHPFVEVEAGDEAAIWRTVERLGLDRAKAYYGSVEIAYQAEYDVTEEEIDNWDRVTFTSVPDWLQVRAKRS
jgi:adenylate cyclase class 2